jgi:hypothetical protein
MGWGSGGNIFDLVTHGLIEAGAEDRVVDRVCTDLARALMDEDWDTEDESLDEVSGYPVVQHAIRKAARELDLYDTRGDYAGRLEFDAANGGSWLLDDSGARCARPARCMGSTR